MKDYSVCKTIYNNYYLTNANSPYFIYLNPLTLYFLKNDGSQDCENALPSKLVIDEREYFEDEIKYYYHKYLWLKSFNFFKKESAPGFKKVSGLITENKLKSILANLTNIVFEVTDACNLKCTYCGYGDLYTDYDDRNNAFMKFETAKAIIDYLVNYWNSSLNHSPNRKITFGFYGGEPLLNMELIRKVVEYVEQVCPPVIKKSFNMTTNGVLLDKHIEFLVNKDFKIAISLDGNERNHSYRVTHDNINSFKKVSSNIQYVKNIFPEFFSSNVNFNSVLHNRNSINEIITFIEKEYGKKPLINGLNTTRIDPNKSKEFEKLFKNTREDVDMHELSEKSLSTVELSDSEFRKAVMYFHQGSKHIIKKYSDLFSPQNENFIPTATCLPFEKKMFITVNGKILPCERIGHKTYFGKIKDEKVEIDIKDIVNRYNNLYKQMQKHCSRCYGFLLCPHCIFHLKHKDGIYCSDILNLSNLNIYISSIISFIEKDPKLYKQVLDVKFE